MYLNAQLITTIKASFFSVEGPVRRESTGYEFLLVQSGSVEAAENEERFRLSQRDILLLQPGTPCRLTPYSRNFILSLQLERELMDSILPKGFLFFCNSALEEKEAYKELAEILEMIFQYYDQEEKKNAFLANLYRLMDLLESRFLLPASTKSTASESRPEALSKSIRQYIALHFQQPLTASELSEHFFLSPQYLSRVFREQFGESFHKYLNRVRLEHAMDELLETDHPITDIAFHNGFPNVSAFYRVYRERNGSSPADLRKASKEKGKETVPSPLLPSGETASPVRSHLTLSFSECKSFYAAWTDTINIGNLANALSHSFHNLFEQVQQQVHFRYIRFHNLFSSDFVPPEAGGRYSFGKIDRILDLFQEYHALPFIELGMKPDKTSLAGLPEETLPPSSPELPLSGQLAFLKEFLRHAVNRYGHDYVSAWRFELWATHDELLNYWEAPKDYAERFLSFRSLIRSLLPKALMGGPGFNTIGSPSLFQEYLAAMIQKNAAPDFISIYIFSYEPKTYESKILGRDRKLHPLSQDPDFCSRIYGQYREIADSFFNGTPLYITEFNSGLNGLNYVAASAFQAAFLCRNLLSLSRSTDCIAYWYLSDLIRISPLHPRRSTSGVGLFSRFALPKPAYHGIRLLSLLRSRIHIFSPDCITAVSGQGLYQILLINYFHYNRNYCFSSHSRIPLSETYDIFDSPTDKELSISLTDLPAGHYRVTRHRLNREHGSLLDVFLGAIKAGTAAPAEIDDLLLNLQKYEIEYYAGTVVPYQEIGYLDRTEDGEPRALPLTLLPHEVTLIQLERKL